MEISINKIAAGVVGLAMVAGLAFAFTATQAHAAELTLSDLVELFIGLGIIDEDKADEARAAVEDSTTAPTAPGTGVAGAVACTGTFSRNLTVGDTGADVKELQMLLNSRGFTVATAGAPGSAGMESEYFGPATKSAVTAMQNAFAGEILTPLGLTAGTGFFGASTRVKANALCSATTPTVPGDDDEDGDDDDTDTSDLSGEASLSDVSISDADDSDVEEGQEEAEIAEIDVEFSDGDAMITRLDIALELADGEPWDAFDTVYLMVDGDVVAEMDASDEDEYLDEDDGTLRFSGLDIVAMEDEEVTIVVAADIQGNLDALDMGTWEVFVVSMRYVDGDDVTTTVNDEFDLAGGSSAPWTGVEEAASFDLEVEGIDDEVIVKTSTSDLDDSIIKLEDDSKSDFETIFVFDIDTDDSTNDIEFDTIVVDVASLEADGVTATNTDLLINDAILVIDGEEFDNPAITVNGSKFTFDIDGDLVVDAGDRVKVEFKAEFLSLAPALEGAYVTASADGADIDSEGADDITATGSATGGTHQVMSSGVYAEIVSVDEDSQGTDGDIGVFTIKFDVTAFEGDFYIEDETDGTTGVAYSLEGATTTDTAVLSSTADEEGANVWVVREGETETFTLKVNAMVDTAGDVRVVLEEILYAGSAANAVIPANVDTHSVSPAEDFRTDYLLISA